ncbi:diglucosylglycerate octanoyltransferase [Williamsia deligens]|uniref:diglucosylglycerate octanoyltransferase n=1 Tax=Williamsia deligens TaxID=321325 RepID=UPI0026466594
MVLSDSLAYYGPTGGLPADDPRIWPNLLGAAVGRPVELFGRIGWTSRDIWWALIQDPRVWAAVPRACVVVLAIGGMDTLPSPLPTALREQIRYIRPAWLRQRVRDAYGWMQPAMAPLGWPVALPAGVTVEHLEKVRDALAAVRPDLPVVLCLPSTHDSEHYARVHTARAGHTAAMRRWADAHGVATADFYPATAHWFGVPGAQNPDGIHWGFDCHRDIADEVTRVVGPIVASPRLAP